MTSHLHDILKNPKGKLIAVDMDGTLCVGEYWGRPEDTEPVPNEKIAELVRRLYMEGGHIVLYTARQPRMYATTHAWLVKHHVPFHGICMTMKPGADLYIEDKAIHPDHIV